MSSQKKAQINSLSDEQLIALVIDSIQDIKGKNIVKIDLRQLDDAPTDYFIICEGDSNTQVSAIADNIYGRVKKEGFLLPSHYEGQQNALWVLLDYFNIVIHIFYKERRSYYQLEDLWGDGVFTEYKDL